MFDNILLKRKGVDEIMKSYSLELGEMTRGYQFDIPGHMDVPVRNGRPNSGRHRWQRSPKARPPSFHGMGWLQQTQTPA